VNAAIAGGHGQIVLALEKLLAARGDAAIGLIRNPDHAVALLIEAAEAAAVLLACLDDDTTVGATFDLIGGEDSIADALLAL
jgi:NAD(P)-dependent dehydrogenase (short-subunit alcohol dehydrogenase family)